MWDQQGERGTLKSSSGKPDKTWIPSPTPEDELAGQGYDFPEGWPLSLVRALKLVYIIGDA